MTETFAARMRQLRAERGLSLRGLARATIHGKSYLHELETGLKYPTSQVAQRVDDALDAEGTLVALAAQRPEPRREFVAAGTAVDQPHPLPRQGRQAGPGLPQQLADRTARLRRVDEYLGGADTYSMYTAELESTTNLVRSVTYTEATGRALLSVLAEQAQLAGWAAFDAGRYAEAEQLYRSSHAAARDAEDSALAGNALLFLSYQDLALGRPGVDAASAACDTAGSGATRGVRALLHCRRAWAHAIAGQAGAAEQHLNLGAGCLTKDDGRPEPDWVYWVDRTEVEIMTGRCWAVLRRPLRAIPVLERVLGNYQDTQARDKALYLTWLADAYLDANEVEQACATASKAMWLSAGLGSVRPGQRLDGVLSRLEPYAALPCVAELRTQATERRRQIGATIPDTPQHLR